MEWVYVCDAVDLDDEDLFECRVDDHELLLIKTEGRFIACPAVCPHMEERLAHGSCDGKVLTCSKHLWQWDLETGDPIGLAEIPLAVAPVQLQEGKVYVDITPMKCLRE